MLFATTFWIFPREFSSLTASRSLLTYLDFAFPDPAWRTSYSQLQEILSIIRVQLAIVIVAFPIFLFMWNYLLREVRLPPGHTALQSDRIQSRP